MSLPLQETCSDRRQETGEETIPHFGLIYRFTHLQNPQEFPGSVCLLSCFLSTAAE